MIWIGGLIGLILGGVVATLILLARASRARTELALAEQRAQQYAGQLGVVQQELAALREKFAELDRLAAELSTQRDLFRESAHQLAQERDGMSTAYASASESLARATSEREGAVQRLDDQRRLMVEQDQRHHASLLQQREAFVAASAEALQKSSEQFLQLAGEKFATLSAQAAGTLDERKAQIATLVTPLNEQLSAYQQRLAQIEASRVEGYGKLQEQIGALNATNLELRSKTDQLSLSLRQTGARGRWGEATLKRLVELAGLSSYCDFCEQTSVDGENGRLRPDMTVMLPGGGTVVIDSKVPLDAYLDATESRDATARDERFTAHAKATRGHVASLSAKSYFEQFERSPEFVVLFMPGESFLYAAIEKDSALLDDAMGKRVVIATPTTLIALLRTLAFGWREQIFVDNARDIKQLGSELVDRVGIVGRALGELGTSLSRTIKNYDQLVGSFDGRLRVTARKMQELGAGKDTEIVEAKALGQSPRIPVEAAAGGDTM